MVHDHSEELFEIFDDRGRPLGVLPRAEVHRRGIWHRAVNVFLFDAAGRLYLQRRSRHKDVGPGLWDLSAAEHLHPGESFESGAHRGLAEELGVTGVLLAAYPGTFREKLEQGSVRDWEIQRCFHGRYAGQVRPDPEEVAQVRTASRDELAAALRRDPHRYTSWFRRRVLDVDLLGSGWCE